LPHDAPDATTSRSATSTGTPEEASACGDAEADRAASDHDHGIAGTAHRFARYRGDA
jgi:hypothetical protein